MKLQAILSESLDIELTNLSSTVDEEVLKDMLDPWYQRLMLKGRQVLDYYKCTIDAVLVTLNHEFNKAMEDPEAEHGDADNYKVGSYIVLDELFYSVKEKRMFAKIAAVAVSNVTCANLHLMYDLLDGRPTCKRIKPTHYPKHTDDDIDLTKVLPERVLDEDWQ